MAHPVGEGLTGMEAERQPRTDAGRAMLQAWARRSWSRFALRLAILDIEAEARVGDPSGTTTECPLKGVHEHAFRGPHRFHEWEPLIAPEDWDQVVDISNLRRTGARYGGLHAIR